MGGRGYTVNILPDELVQMDGKTMTRRHSKQTKVASNFKEQGVAEGTRQIKELLENQR